MNMTTAAEETVAPPRSPARRVGRNQLIGAIDWIMPTAAVGLMIWFSLATASFRTPDNLLAIASQNAPTFVVASVAAMLLMAGFVDLSVGSVMALAGVCAGMTFNSFGLVLGVLAALGIGLAAGAVNGYLIGYLRFSPIVVTLGLLAAGRGAAQFLAPGSVFGFPPGVQDFGSGSVFGVSYLVIVAVAVIALSMFLMNGVPFGRRVIAVGANPRAAYLNGVNVRRLVFLLYAGIGLAAGLAGLLQVARLNSAPSASLGLGFEVTVLTAVLLGGIPFDGGRGSIWRVVLGVWLIGTLRNGLTLMNVSVELSGIITGAVLVGAAGLEALRAHLKGRG